MSIKIENVEVGGWKAAIRGARNPMNSWEKSDSLWFDGEEYYDICGNSGPAPKESNGTGFDVGYSDHKLLMNLCKGGSEESKWRRFVHVSMDITAPLYWWKEFDTYKVGTACNSCSTMHKIQAKEFTLEDFSCEHLFGMDKNVDWRRNSIHLLEETIKALNYFREKFLETKDKKYWWQMIQLLPSSYNQRRTIDLNYEVLAKQYQERKNHKLDEWREYCEWIKMLPYSELITMEE